MTPESLEDNHWRCRGFCSLV